VKRRGALRDTNKNKKYTNDLNRWYKKSWFKKSVWVYPAILLILLVGATLFKINGSSVGMYHEFLYGLHVKDPNLVYGEPKLVRADEWQNWTQLAISQKYNDYNKYNPNLGSGRNLALQVEVPYKDWATTFRPHTWSFLFLNFDRAFALKWWVPLFLLLISSYFFTLRILPGKRLFAALFSISVGLSPFLLWWYQTAAIATIAYGFFILILFHRIIDCEGILWLKSKKLADTLYVLGLFFILACFELLLYPPFQIPVALVVIFYCLGFLLERYFGDRDQFRFIMRRFGLVLISVLLAGFIGIAFITSNRAPINALSDSLYPGKRIVQSGDLPLLHLVNGYLMPLEQNGATPFRNLSEGSNFILVTPFLLIPGFILLAYEYYKKRKIHWVFLFVQLCAALFIIRSLLHFGDGIYKILLLDKVPGARLLIGLGFVGFIQFLYLIKLYAKVSLSKLHLWSAAIFFGGASFMVLGVTSLYVHHHYLKIIPSKLLLVLFSFIFAAIIFTCFIKKPLLAALSIFIFTVISSARVMPLYNGLGLAEDSELISSIQKYSKPGDTWATLDDARFENVALAAGRKNLSGTQIYPDNAFWSQVAGSKFEKAYNREGHVYFTTEPIQNEIKYVKPNLFKIKFQCSKFIIDNIDYALSENPLEFECVNLIKIVSFPKEDFYIYKVSGRN